MNTIKAIKQLENIQRDRLKYVYNETLNETYLNDIKAISLAIVALKRCPDVKDNTFRCKICGKELKTWKSIQRGMGPICELKYIQEIYKKQQVSLDSIVEKTKERRGN